MKKVIALLLALSAPAAAATEHQVVETEHLWSLAKRYYGNPYQWRAIAQANADIKDPHWIYPRQVIIIPDLPEAPLQVETPAPVEAAVAVAAAEAGAVAVTPMPEPLDVKPLPAAEEPPALLSEKDGLSVELPEGLAGQYPSMTRFDAPRDWKPDGSITEYEDREAMAAEGDFVSGLLKKGNVVVGEKLYVLREDATEDIDEDTKARHFVRVAVVSVQRDLGKGRCRLLILKSGDSVQLGDLLSKRRL